MIKAAIGTVRTWVTQRWQWVLGCVLVVGLWLVGFAWRRQSSRRVVVADLPDTPERPDLRVITSQLEEIQRERAESISALRELSDEELAERLRARYGGRR